MEVHVAIHNMAKIESTTVVQNTIQKLWLSFGDAVTFAQSSEETKTGRNLYRRKIKATTEKMFDGCVCVCVGGGE